MCENEHKLSLKNSKIYIKKHSGKECDLTSWNMVIYFFHQSFSRNAGMTDKP